MPPVPLRKHGMHVEMQSVNIKEIYRQSQHGYVSREEPGAECLPGLLFWELHLYVRVGLGELHWAEAVTF